MNKAKSQAFIIGGSKRGDIVDKRTLELPGPGNYGDANQFG
jgi:hypothetical protein